jgi:hypothetical protein
MTPAMLWSASGAFGVLALVAALGERRRRRRHDLDRIGWIDWPGVQLFAITALILTAGLALRAK